MYYIINKDALFEVDATNEHAGFSVGISDIGRFPKIENGNITGKELANQYLVEYFVGFDSNGVLSLGNVTTVTR